jgi:hypothetical protein
MGERATDGWPPLELSTSYVSMGPADALPTKVGIPDIGSGRMKDVVNPMASVQVE